MGDEKLVRMKKPIKREEEIVLMRTLLKDGMTQKQAESYMKVICKEVKNNHEKHKKELNRKKKKKKKMDFVKAFKKLTRKK